MTLAKLFSSKWDEFLGIAGKYKDTVRRHNWFIKNCDRAFLKEIIKQDGVPTNWLKEFSDFDLASRIAKVDKKVDKKAKEYNSKKKEYMRLFLLIKGELELYGSLYWIIGEYLPDPSRRDNMSEVRGKYMVCARGEMNANEFEKIINDGFDIISKRVEFIYNEQVRMEKLMRDREEEEPQAASVDRPEVELETGLGSEEEELERMLQGKYKKTVELLDTYDKGILSLYKACEVYSKKSPKSFSEYCKNNKFPALSHFLRGHEPPICDLGSRESIKDRVLFSLGSENSFSLVRAVAYGCTDSPEQLFRKSDAILSNIKSFPNVIPGQDIDGKIKLIEHEIDDLFGEIERYIKILQSVVDEVELYAYPDKERKEKVQPAPKVAPESAPKPEPELTSKTNPTMYKRFEDVINKDYGRLKGIAKKLNNAKLNGYFNSEKSVGEKFSIIYKETFWPVSGVEIRSANIWKLMPSVDDKTEGRAVAREIGSKIQALLGERARDLCKGEAYINKDEMDELESLIDEGLNIVETAIDRYVNRRERQKAGAERPARQELSSAGLNVVKTCYLWAAAFISGGKEDDDFSELSKAFNSVPSGYPFWQGIKDLSGSKKYLVSTQKKAVALLFVSMSAVGSLTTAVQHFCDAIKQGGINKNSHDKVILEADMIRYLVKSYAKAHPDSSISNEDFNDYLKTVLVDKFKFVSRTEFDSMSALFKRNGK